MLYNNIDTIDIKNQIERMNPGSESYYDSEKRIFVIKVTSREIKLPDDCEINGHHVYDKDFEKKICRLELVN